MWLFDESRLPLPIRCFVVPIALAALVQGCTSEKSPPPTQALVQSDPLPNEDRSPLGGDDGRRFDFGQVIGAPGLRLTHVFPLRNSSDRPVKVLRALNAKPCCGEVEPMQPTTLQPGETAHLKVTVHAGTTIGVLQHRTLVEIDDPNAPPLEFWTLATVHPGARIEASHQGVPDILAGRSAALDFTVLTYGTKAHRPLPLGDSAVQSPLSLAWASAATEHAIDDGVIERSRSFTLHLKANDDPGPKSSVLRVVDSGTVVLDHPVRWEVIPPITQTPKMVVLTPEKREVVVLLRSRDGTRFRVTKVEFDTPGLRGAARESKRALQHAVRVEAETTVAHDGRRMSMKVVTDHPSQGVVVVRVAVLD